MTMTAALRTLVRCLVCGFTEVRTDEVIDRGVVLLHECPRCEHRWTQGAYPDRPARTRHVRVVRAPSERTAA
jgi:ribosomal protein L37AE/L43A